MGNSAGKITAPVNTDDVGTVIGVASHDVATLCSSTKNNKWSKHKPVRGESPASYATWDRNTGNVRGVVGYPIYWGMRMPFNNGYQLNITNEQGGTLGSRWLKPLAIRAAHLLNETQCGNVKNYEYMQPVVGTDFCRLDDYVGYNHNAPEAWTCGVQGAEVIAGSDSWTGSPGMLINVDSFDTSEVGFYIGMPSNADLSFKDLYDSGDYRFIVELYEYGNRLTDGADPKAVIVCMTPIASMTFGATFNLLVSWLKTKFGFQGDGEHNIFAVAGVVRFGSTVSLTELKRTNTTGLGCAELPTANYNVITQGEGSIPPWTDGYKPFICQISLRSFSKLDVVAKQYATPTSSSYSDFPSTAINLHADGLNLKMEIRNKGTNAVILNHSNTGPKFQFQAHGAYDTSDPTYSAMCDSPSDGKWHNVTKISNVANFETTPQITIAAGATNSAVYMQCLGFLPIGRTSSVTIRVSTDGGTTWVITGSFSAPFIVP